VVLDHRFKVVSETDVRLVGRWDAAEEVHVVVITCHGCFLLLNHQPAFALRASARSLHLRLRLARPPGVEPG